MRRAMLLALALLLLPIAPLRAQTPTRITVSFGPEQVFQIPGHGVIELAFACPSLGSDHSGEGSSACVSEWMRRQGATADAVAFYQLTGRILLDFQPVDTLALGTVTYDIWCCHADTSDSMPVILGGVPAVVYPLLEAPPLRSYPGYSAALGAFPSLTAGHLHVISIERIDGSPEQGDRYVYDLRLTNGCRVCDTGYVARLALDFDADGTFISAVPLNIVCRPLQTRPTCVAS